MDEETMFLRKYSKTKVIAPCKRPGSTLVPSPAAPIHFENLHAVLHRANAKQLESLEDRYPFLLEHTGDLWKALCQREFKQASRQEMETWRETHKRCREELENKLNALIRKHDQFSASSQAPANSTNCVRSAIELSFEECVAKSSRKKKACLKRLRR